MKYKALIAASLAILFVPSAAHAVSITNNDKKEYQLTIFEGEKSRDLTIKPSETIDGVCEKLCSIRHCMFFSVAADINGRPMSNG